MTSQIEFDNVYQGKLSDLLILAMVSDTEMSGRYQANPFHFQNFGANYICIQANGEQIPSLAYQPKYFHHDNIRSYFGVLEALGFDISQNCWATVMNIHTVILFSQLQFASQRHVHS